MKRTIHLRNWSHAWRGDVLPCLALAALFASTEALATSGVCDTAGPIEAEGTVLGTAPTAYATLGAAFAAINAGTHTGTIAIDVCGDTDEGTATATLNASGSGAASYTAITMSPAGGAARTISGATTAGNPMIDFSGADNVTIDGLNTGGNSLTISNTTASATSGTSTIRFINGATNNTITNSSIQGSFSGSVATNGGNIFFSTDATTANGNDNNTISNNNIGPAGANLPTKAIYGSGSTTTTAIGNSGIAITNNNIFDYFGAAVTSSGVATNGGCNNWSITNNRLYQTATRTWTTGSLHTAINIQNTTATSGAQGFTITGNTIGFASSAQTGTYTLTGAGTGAKFIGILFNGIATGTTTSVNNNTVASVSMTGVTSSGTTTASPFTAILFQEGNGITNNNTIGSQSATGSLVFSTTTTSATDVYGIHNFSSNAWTSNGNTVGGISATNLGASGTFLLIGMRAFTGSTVAWTGNSNTVGGTVANSIQLNATGTASQVLGMFTSNAPALLTSNIIRNMATNIGTGTTTGASMIGISITSATPNSTLSQNTISNLSNSNTAAASIVTGIQFNGSTANLVERNSIYGLTAASNSTAAEVNGIRVAGGTTVYRNNMIALGAGIDNAIGTGSTTGGVSGINEPAGTNTFFHNSVYIGGAPTAGVGPSYAFNSAVSTNTRSFRDNIFFNARSNSGATGKNYAVRVGGTAPNPTGLTINNNLYFANGAGAVFGFFNSLDVANLSAWKTAVGQDVGSFESNPQFLDPTNATPDLHLHPTLSTVAEGNGADVGVTNDFDGQTRSSLTPVDIGADAGNFTGIDVSPPSISYTALSNTASLANRAFSPVTITDVTGVNTTAGTRPRIYYKKSTDANDLTGWKFLEANGAGGSPFDFTIDYALLNAGSVGVGDTIQYFVVAQDTASTPNVGITAGTFAAQPSSVALTSAAFPIGGSINSYNIQTTISGTKTVCPSGCDYATLTGAGGAFADINNKVATSNLELQIAGDLIVGEDGSNGLNALSEQPSGSNFTVKIYPTGGVRAMTGSFNGALVRVRGASRVTIDGSIGGTGTDRSLTITNTSVTTPSVVLFGSVGSTPITNGTLKNCVVINGANTSSAVVISDANTLGNAGVFSNITIQNNDIQKAFVGVFATGGATPQNGSNLIYTQNTVNTSGANAIRNVGLYMQGVNGATVSQNTVGNFEQVNSENDVGIWLASGTINATVSGNTVSTIGYTGTGAFGPIGINVTSSVASTNNNVTGNSVSDISSNGSTQVRGIVVAGATSDLTIQKNNVQGITSTNTGTFGAYGIDVSGGNNIVVKNNFVSNVSFNMTGGSAFSTTFGVFGIRVGAGTGHKIDHNSVNLYGALPGTATSSLLTAAFGLVGTTSTGCDVRNNVFVNNITGGTTSIAHVAAYLPAGGTSSMNLAWNNNAYYFGTDAARQGVGQAGTTAGTNFFTTLAALAAYSSTLSAGGTNDNASQAATTPAPFVSANDLHLTGVGTALDNAGASGTGVTDDIDGETRGTTPDVGADEIVLPTPTPTDTPTNTPTDTPTNTPTDTPTSTPTDTPTDTPTNLPTNTPTNTPTSTPTNTPTATPTNTPTATPTSTPTATSTATPTNTPTMTPTSTPTDTPTNTPTSTPTDTPTSTPTDTPTNTPTDTPVNTNTPTNTPTATPTNTLGPPTATNTPTSTPTSTATDTPTNTPTSTVTNTGTATDTPTSTPTNPPTGVVISQVYGAGGEVGSVWRNDFVELFNRSGSPVNLTNWAVQYANTNSSTWQSIPLSGTLQPGQYYLVQLGTGASGGAPMPPADASGTTVLNTTLGKVALTSSRMRIASLCPAAGTYLDFVGYGSGVTCSEGGTPTADLGLTLSAQRNGNGCLDSNVNGADFTVQDVAAPGPRNSAYPLNYCGAPTPTPTPIPPTPTPGTPTPTPFGANIVISQVYGSSGGVGSPWKSDFVELFNRGSTPVNLYGWSLQYANTDSATWQKTLFPIGTVLQPGRYLLIKQGGSGAGAALPPADISNTVLMNATLGKVALVYGTDGLIGKCPAAGTYVDFVGYGSAVSCSDGSPTADLSNPNSAVRNGNGCVDTNDNGADFTVQSASSPGPRNSTSPANVCSGTSVASVKGQPASGASKGAAAQLQAVELSETVGSLSGNWTLAAACLLILGVAFGSRRFATGSARKS